MKKTIICGIPMKENLQKAVYTSNDKSLSSSEKAVYYPINAFLEKNVTEDDLLNIILITKRDAYGHSDRHIDEFKEEFNRMVCCSSNASFSIINTEFAQERVVHEKLLNDLVDEIDNGSKIIVDSTYGPKDLPVVIFTAIGFAEKFLECEIENIVYGQASFVDGKVTDTKLCDMSSLYYIGSLTNSIRQGEPDKARKMLKSLLSL